MRRFALLGSLVFLLLLPVMACGGTTETQAPDQESVTGAEVLKATPPPPVAKGFAPGVPTVRPALSETPESGKTVVEVTIRGVGDQHVFEPSEFNFTIGETVTFKVTAADESHTFNIEGLAVDEEVPAGETVEFDVLFFTAQRFRVYCTPHQGQGTDGRITVKSPGL